MKKERLKKFYKSENFINSVEARPLRILAEYFGPQKELEKYKVENTIVFFGSARTLPMKEAKKRLSIVEKKTKTGSSLKFQKDLEHAKNMLAMSKYYEDAVELSKRLTLWGKKLHKGKQKYLICSGGGPGIMEAANKGAFLAKGKSVGFNISLPFETNSNPYISAEHNFEFHYFFMRKYWFAYLAKALVIFPGGFGTLDELAELLTLIQTQKMKKPIPILIYGSPYWKKVLNFHAMVRWGTISEKDLNLFHFSDEVDDAFKFLTKELTKKYGA